MTKTPPEIDPANRPDYIIVGGGTAGCVLAARLSEDEAASVLLVEAGPDLTDIKNLPAVLREPYGPAVLGSDFVYKYVARLTAQRAAAPVVRGRLLGGSSAVNGALFLRGIPEDYDSWGSELWSYAAVIPYFRKAETDLDFGGSAHGNAGPIPVRRYPPDQWLPYQQAFVAAATEAQFPVHPDQNQPSGEGVGAIPLNEMDARRMGTDVTHLAPARSRRNLRVWTDTRASRLVLDRGRVVGVELIRDGRQMRVDADEVVLSAGAIATPQLLMSSGIGPIDVLERAGVQVAHESPGVGAGLQDHPISVLDVELPEEAVGPVPAHQTVLTYTAPASEFRKDMQILPAYTRSLSGHHRFRLTVGLERPTSVGRLTIDKQDGSPSLEYGFLGSSADESRMLNGLEVAMELLSATLKLGSSDRVSPPLPRLPLAQSAKKAWLRAHIQTAQHGCGTCSMTPTAMEPPVVDDRCRVLGLAGLRIVDLSIVPLVPRAGTNATAVMVAERAADLFRSNR